MRYSRADATSSSVAATAKYSDCCCESSLRTESLSDYFLAKDPQVDWVAESSRKLARSERSSADGVLLRLSWPQVFG